jgi:hypothetical protein
MISLVILRTFDVFANEIISTLRIKVIIPLSSQFSVISFNFDLCRAKVLEHREMSPATEGAFQLLGQTYTHSDRVLPLASRRGGLGERLIHRHHVDVVTGTLQEDVAHIAAHDIALHPEAVGGITYLVKDFLVEYLGQFFVRI